MKALGQVEIPAAAVTAAIALLASGVTWLISSTWAEARAAAEFRTTIASHSLELDRLRGLPVDDLKRLPGRFEVFVAAAEMQAKSVEEMKQLLKAGVRPASGKRP